MEQIICIPKNLSKKGDLVAVSRFDYEEYLHLKKAFEVVKAAKSEKEAIKEGRKEILQGKFLTLKELKNGMAR